MKSIIISVALFLYCSICHAEPSKEDIKFCEKTAAIALKIAQKRDENKTLKTALDEVFKEVKSPPPKSMIEFASDIYESSGINPATYAMSTYDVCYAQSDPDIPPEEYNACLSLSKLVESVAKAREAGMTLEEIRKMVTPKKSPVEMQIYYASISKAAFDQKTIAPQGMKELFFSACYRSNIKKQKT